MRGRRRARSGVDRRASENEARRLRDRTLALHELVQEILRVFSDVTAIIEAEGASRGLIEKLRRAAMDKKHLLLKRCDDLEREWLLLSVQRRQLPDCWWVAAALGLGMLMVIAFGLGWAASAI